MMIIDTCLSFHTIMVSHPMLTWRLKTFGKFCIFGFVVWIRMTYNVVSWMGDARTILGLLQQIFTGQTYSVEAAVQVVEATKDKIKSNFANENKMINTSEPGEGPIQDTIPPLSEPVPEDWTTIKGDISLFLTSKTPWLARGMLSHPCAVPNDGLLDLLLVRDNHSMFAKLDMFGKVESGHHIDSDAVSR